jgi:hypothetical protein
MHARFALDPPRPPRMIAALIGLCVTASTAAVLYLLDYPVVAMFAVFGIPAAVIVGWSYGPRVIETGVLTAVGLALGGSLLSLPVALFGVDVVSGLSESLTYGRDVVGCSATYSECGMMLLAAPIGIPVAIVVGLVSALLLRRYAGTAQGGARWLLVTIALVAIVAVSLGVIQGVLLEAGQPRWFDSP